MEEKVLVPVDAGSVDEEKPATIMEAIGRAMQQYYGTENWLIARHKERPGLRKLG
ncbi:MAG: hypothetical protein IIC82_02465 [Chloroflexi bacterium]|nr:hypothetical protein [Chloroflexota bacterium]